MALSQVHLQYLITSSEASRLIAKTTLLAGQGPQKGTLLGRPYKPKTDRGWPPVISNKLPIWPTNFGSSKLPQPSPRKRPLCTSVVQILPLERSLQILKTSDKFQPIFQSTLLWHLLNLILDIHEYDISTIFYKPLNLQKQKKKTPAPRALGTPNGRPMEGRHCCRALELQVVQGDLRQPGSGSPLQPICLEDFCF